VSEKKRLGIYVIYDKDGKVDKYAEHIALELRKVTDRFVIVANGKLDETGKTLMKKYSDEVCVRENIGLDAGAYADVIVNVIGKQAFEEYDEIVLCNDTFYGPFIPMENIFEQMENDKCDFWGMDRIERDFLSYIISYFYVFRKRVIKSGDLYSYFKDNILNQINDISDAYARFEVGLYYTLTKKGYVPSSYTYTEGYYSKKTPNLCVEKYNLPIWKRRFFQKENYDAKICNELLKVIGDRGYYDIKCIQENVERVYGYIIPEEESAVERKDEVYELKYNVPQITSQEIEAFLKNHDNVYIYGAGSFARATLFVFKDKMKDFKGFMVSDKKGYKHDSIWGYPVYDVKDIKEDAIMVALSYKNHLEVVETLGKRENILYYWR